MVVVFVTVILPLAGVVSVVFVAGTVVVVVAGVVVVVVAGVSEVELSPLIVTKFALPN